jgi:hypothetical protein
LEIEQYAIQFALFGYRLEKRFQGRAGVARHTTLSGSWNFERFVGITALSHAFSLSFAPAQESRALK